jgi:small-conductance mechanosensitive channel
MHCIVVLLLCAAACSSARAQDDAEQPAPAPTAAAEYASPKATLRTFIEAMFNGDLARGAQCMDLTGIAPEKHEDLASYLYQCLNRIELLLPEEDPSIPGASELRRNPRLRDATTWIYFPRDTGDIDRRNGEDFREWQNRRERHAQIADVVGPLRIELSLLDDGSWRFSRRTVESIEDFRDTLDEAGIEVVKGLEREDQRTQTLTQRIEHWFPRSMRTNEMVGVKYWQWLSLMFLIFAGLAFDQLVRLIILLITKRIIARQDGDASRETLRKTVRPFGLAAAAIFWLLTLHVVMPTAAMDVINPAVKLFFVLAMVWALYRLTDLLAEVAASKASQTETKFDDLLVPLVRKTVKIFIFVFGLIYIADSLSIPIAPLVTGLGIGGAGFAFAAKDTLEHFFGSVTVIADRPFQVGDWVEIGDTEGTVEEVGLRSTRVRTFYNSLVTIPNGNLVRATVDNYGKRKYRRWSTHLNITYDTPPEKIEAFCEGIRELIRLHPYTRKDYYQVWLHQFGPHSLDILLYVFWQTPDWQTELRERHRLMLDIIRLADRLGVRVRLPHADAAPAPDRSGCGAHTDGTTREGFRLPCLPRRAQGGPRGHRQRHVARPHPRRLSLPGSNRYRRGRQHRRYADRIENRRRRVITTPGSEHDRLMAFLTHAEPAISLPARRSPRRPSSRRE